MRTTTAVRVPAATPKPMARPTFMPVRAGDHGIAVLPFRYRGAASDEYLADALTDELVDLLSNTRGLKVARSRRTARFVGDPDPKTIGRELGVEAIIEGTVQRAGPMVRISARLLATDTGFQTWSERFEGRLDDVFDLQDRMAKRVAESLRVELQQHTSVGEHNGEAVELYLRARKRSRTIDLGGTGPDGALALIERAIELAPHFKPALAAHAMMSERMWFYPGAPRDVDWGERARVSGRARARGGRRARRDPRRRSTLRGAHARSRRRGAFTVARAHHRADVRGGARVPRLPAVRGRSRRTRGSVTSSSRPELESDAHARLASPRRVTTSSRRSCARGPVHPARAQGTSSSGDIGLVAMEARFATWRGDIETVRRCRATILRHPGMYGFFMLVTEVYLGERDAAGDRARAAGGGPGFSPRFTTLGEQLTAEVLANAGRIDGAMAALRRAVDNVLVDLEWLERCPLLEPLAHTSRNTPELHRRVRARAEAIWTIE